MSGRVGREMLRTGIVAALFGLAMVFTSPALAQDASGSSDSGSSEVPIGGTEKFSNSQTQQLEAQIADDEARYSELDSEIKDLKSNPMENLDQIDDLRSQQKQTYREWGRLEEELDRAKLEAIQDAQEGNSTEEQLKADTDKRDALEALKGWSAQYVGILEQPHIDIQDQLKAEEDSVKNLENKAAAEKQKQGDSGSGSSGSGSSGSGSSGSGVPSSDEGGGGISLAPLVLGLLLLGGVVYGVVAGGSGLAGRVRGLVGTPLAGGRAPRGGATGASTGAAPSPPPPSEGSGSFADPGPGSGPEPRTSGGGGDPPGESPGPGAGGGAGGGGAPEGSAGSSGGEDPDEWPDDGHGDGAASGRSCIQCGSEVSRAAKFCRECGEPVR